MVIKKGYNLGSKGRPKSKNPSKQAIKKRIYRLKKNNNKNEFINKVIRGIENFLKSPFKKEEK